MPLRKYKKRNRKLGAAHRRGFLTETVGEFVRGSGMASPEKNNDVDDTVLGLSSEPPGDGRRAATAMLASGVRRG